MGGWSGGPAVRLRRHGARAAAERPCTQRHAGTRQYSSGNASMAHRAVFNLLHSSTAGSRPVACAQALSAGLSGRSHVITAGELLWPIQSEVKQEARSIARISDRISDRVSCRSLDTQRSTRHRLRNTQQSTAVSCTRAPSTRLSGTQDTRTYSRISAAVADVPSPSDRQRSSLSRFSRPAHGPARGSRFCA